MAAILSRGRGVVVNAILVLLEMSCRLQAIVAIISRHGCPYLPRTRCVQMSPDVIDCKLASIVAKYNNITW